METSFQYRAAIIIDNPIRDLDGLVLLARKLGDQGIESFLVPMYSQGFIVPALSPDVVILNYARHSNAPLIRQYLKAGIRVAILETEGGIWESEEQYAKTIADDACAEFIDRYFVWGKRQREVLVSRTRLTPDQVVVTGNPRFDFYAEPWKRSLSVPVEIEKPFILVLSSSPLAAPRFTASPMDEVKALESVGYEREYALQRLKDDQHARKELVAAIEKLAADFAERTVVVRPHPFESDEDFVFLRKRYPNVRIIREGSVAHWIREASSIVHITSSTAVDTFLMGKIALSMDWALTPSLRKKCPLTLAVSANARNYNELKDFVNSAETLRDPITAETKQWLGSWFCVDGHASERVAQSVAALIAEKRTARSSFYLWAMALRGSRTNSLRHWLNGVVRWVLGSAVYERIKFAVLYSGNSSVRQAKIQKRPSYDHVVKLNRLLDSIEGNPARFVSNVKRGQSLCFRLAKEAIYFGTTGKVQTLSDSAPHAQEHQNLPPFPGHPQPL